MLGKEPKWDVTVCIYIHGQCESPLHLCGVCIRNSRDRDVRGCLTLLKPNGQEPAKLRVESVSAAAIGLDLSGLGWDDDTRAWRNAMWRIRPPAQPVQQLVGEGLEQLREACGLVQSAHSDAGEAERLLDQLDTDRPLEGTDA